MEEYILKIFKIGVVMLMLAFLLFVSTPSCFPSKEYKRQVEEFKKNKQEGKISNPEIEYDYNLNLPFVLFFRFILYVGLGLLFVSFVLSFTQGIEFTKELFFLMVKTGKSFILSFLNIEN
jgi:hypothetical protein